MIPVFLQQSRRLGSDRLQTKVPRFPCLPVSRSADPIRNQELMARHSSLRKHDHRPHH